MKETEKRVRRTSPTDPVRPRERAKKQGTNTAEGGKKVTGAVMYILLILGVSMLLSTFIILTANDMFALVSDENKTVTLTFEEAPTVSQAAKELKKNGIIRYQWAFKLYASLKHNDTFKTGTFDVKDTDDYGQILDTLNRVSTYQETVQVTIPEGFNLQQIAKELENNRICSADEFIETCNTYPFKHEILQDVPMIDNRLEGYLYPDTYEFYVNESPVRVANKMLNTFVSRYTDEMKDYTEKSGMSLHDIVIIASLVEKEAKLDTERATIAGVIYNRLNSSAYPYLNLDSTIHYAVGSNDPLTADNLKVDSPYNTYTQQGLPPTAICSPGTSSILSAIMPEKHKYYFFVAVDDSGGHVFSKTLEEHQKLIASMKK